MCRHPPRSTRAYTLLPYPDALPISLARQCIPADPDLWKLENYERFLQARREMLASELNTFLNSTTELTDSDVPITLEEMIAEGESEELEFKQSSEEHTYELQSLMRNSYAVIGSKTQ